jgi:hypothetical protein
MLRCVHMGMKIYGNRYNLNVLTFEDIYDLTSFVKEISSVS